MREPEVPDYDILVLSLLALILLIVVLLLPSCALPTDPRQTTRRHDFGTSPGEPGGPQVAMAGTWRESPGSGLAWVLPDGGTTFVLGPILFFQNGVGGQADPAQAFSAQARFVGYFQDSTVTAELSWTDLPESVGVASGSLTARWSPNDSIPDTDTLGVYAPGQVLRCQAVLAISGGRWIPQSQQMPSLRFVKVP